MKRNLKVGEHSRTNTAREIKFFPEIKLAGKWLKEAGFKKGQLITVCTDFPGSITIELMTPEKIEQTYQEAKARFEESLKALQK